MDILYWVIIFTCSIASAYYIIKLNDDRLFGNKSEIRRELKAANEEIKFLRGLIHANIDSVGKANGRVDEIKKDLACFTAKIDKRELEINDKLASSRTDYDNLQEHCVKLRESIIDVKEIVAGKRPLHRHEPITIMLAPDLLKRGDTIKKVKKQIKEFEQ